MSLFEDTWLVDRLNDFHDSTKKYDPLTHYAVEGSQKSGDWLVSNSSEGLSSLGHSLGLNTHLPDMVGGHADENFGNFGLSATRTGAAAASIYGGMSAYGAYGSAGSGGGSGTLGATGGDGAFLGEGTTSGVPAWDSAPTGANGFDYSSLMRNMSNGNQQQQQGGDSQPQQQPEQQGLGFAASSPQTVPALRLDPIGSKPAALPDEDQKYLQSLPTAQRIGLALQAFSAGVSGGPSPVAALLQRRRQQQQDFQAQAEHTAGLMTKGMEAVRQFPEGSEGRAAAVQMYARAAGPMGKEVAAALGAVGTGDEAQFKDIAAALGVTAGLDALRKLSGNDPRNASKVMQDKEGQKAVYDAVTKAVLPGLISKAQVFDKMIEQMPEGQFKDAAGKPSFSIADLERLNTQLPKEQQITPQEFLVLRHSGNSLVPYGFKTDEMVKKEQERTAAAADRKVEWDRQEKQRVEDRKDLLKFGSGLKVSGSEAAGTKEEKEADRKFQARQYLAGDKSVLQGMGRGVAGDKARQELRREIRIEATAAGLSPEEVAVKLAEFEGVKAGERALGTRSAALGIASAAANEMATLAEKASAEVSRTKFIPINQALLAYEKRTGDPAVVKLGAATNSFINAYARAVNGGSSTGGTVHDKQHAREMLENSFSHEQYVATISQLKAEMAAEMKAPGIVKKEMRDLATDGKSRAAAPAGPFSDADKEKRYQDWKARQAK